MSNKLVKHQEPKEILTGNQKKILFWICFIILSIAFITVWINILLTSKAFNTQMEEMVLGEDYYMEDIVITGKRAEAASADTISRNYFFYYNNGKVNDYHKRMQVPGFVYSEYNVGDSIAAYTTDHVSYSYYKYGILPDTEYTNNELMKVAGVLLGIGIFLLALFGVLSKKMNYKKQPTSRLLGSRRERKIGICGVVNMKKKILKAVLGILICWGIFVAIEGFRLIGSTDPGKCPLITLGSTQTADEIADYGSLGFSQTYHLTNGDAFVYGEFRVWGIRIARWES